MLAQYVKDFPLLSAFIDGGKHYVLVMFLVQELIQKTIVGSLKEQQKKYVPSGCIGYLGLAGAEKNRITTKYELCYLGYMVGAE